MRWIGAPSVLALVAFAATCAFASTTRADPLDDLVAKGQELGKQGSWTQAIDAFKQADAQRHRAEYACLIGLAYTRRELWPQAELFFARCHARVNGADPLPPWAAEAEAELAAKLAAANIPTLAIETTPADATIAVSGFPSDETFAPGTIHLAPGHYTLRASAPGYVDATRDLTVATGDHETVVLHLERVVHHTLAPWIVIGGGVAVALGGLAIDQYELQPLRTADRKSYFNYTKNHGAFQTWQGAAIGCWIGAAIAVGVGAWLVHHERTRPVDVTARIDRDGGAVIIGWTR